MVGLLVDLRHPGLPIDLKAYEWLKKLRRASKSSGQKPIKQGKMK